ncbi:MAG: UDP-N-acetyl-D-glucosamine 2-epimerase, UDP-hydrolysing [Candidatus Magasanikbacteria bacterium RIFCSPHIGHO2_02_FULL_51_14]|uniref:UDP-N-acetyl-D-glucosamine 2-epimerase, UDP-hydrolysing n=1 Tax=Candidatus Magasanikbacteria bacterium RIFCSPHIGHO2_02_FULL_51_14 TaxID=1798683 RepID=A0A1F6MCZ7_9BACT|nr:MAG: UDP-N-acetyl-D-glucosamine 2-epimerase, UDP-hydrolysing [Candidatus Magasanikbacteria bacterium RIFCSPHIGHO2_02_FULL_51_14]
MIKRKILFVTERRADYSRLKPIMKAVQKSEKLELLLLITGAHLLKNLGETKRVVEADGFRIDATLPIFHEDDPDDGRSMVKAMARALDGMADIFPKLKPDIVFCGFDLGAHLAAAIVGVHLNMHVAHIQGGEVSGTIDEMLRHACTKFAHLHFVATEKSRERVIKLGEDPNYVFLVGSPSLDTVKHINYPSKDEICAAYHLDPKKKLAIFLQHPVTTEIEQVARQMRESIAAVEDIQKRHALDVIAIYSNNDAGGKMITRMLQESGIRAAPHIVYEDFLRLMRVADVLVGNSSSGIHEAPSFGLPTVNIGSRQQHRERGNNVIDVENKKEDIISAIEKALFDEKFIKEVQSGKNPYDHGNTAEQTVKILEEIDLPPIQKVITY